MENLRQYIILVVALSIVLAILSKLTEKTATHKIFKVVSGIVLTVALLSPLRDIDLSTYISQIDSVEFDAKEAATYGEEIYTQNMRTIIEQQCQAYILEKAAQLGVTIQISIQCDNSEVPTPSYAEISGNVSPYIRRTLADIIFREIGIPEENQLWT